LELKRTELLTKYEPSYRLVQEVEQQIEQAQAAIAAERLAPIHEETTEKDPNYEWAKGELEKSEVELSALMAREQGIRVELARSRAETRHLGEASIRQQDLLRNMKTAEDSYLLYAKKTEEARIGDALDERGIVNVTLVAAPVAPVLPKRSGWLVVFLGVLAAGACSTLLAFTVDYLNPGFRSPEEVVACLRAPILASLPREGGEAANMATTLGIVRGDLAEDVATKTEQPGEEMVAPGAKDWDAQQFAQEQIRGLVR
jgi:uncharacterized protein involved in exopolysaccharide biosynthesis